MSSSYPIDFVVLWVDGSDPNWLNKKRKFKPETKIADSITRYRERGTFKYWFRAVEKYAPWVNHIYVVTDNQKPEWLNENHPKLTIVDHKDIIDKKYLPTFNSQAIEMNIHKIPGLSEHFVYFNDDMFLVNKTESEDFFKNGLPVAIANINAATGMQGDQLYARTMFNDILLINRHFDKKEVVDKHLLKWLNPKYGSFNLRTLMQLPYPYFTGYKPQHVPSPLLKSTVETVWKEEKETLENTCSHKFRHKDDVNQDIFSLWQICSNSFIPGSKRKGASILLRDKKDLETIVKMLNSHTKRYICINDSVSEACEMSSQSLSKKLCAILGSKLPRKSSYEK